MSTARPILRLTLPSGSVKFPPGCLECNGTPDWDRTLSRRKGNLSVSIPAPLCKACARKRQVRRLAWHVAWITALFALLIPVAVLQEMGLSQKYGPVMLAIITGVAVLGFWLTRNEDRLFHARYSRIWIDGFETAPTTTLTLASRDGELLRDVAERSGVPWTEGA